MDKFGGPSQVKLSETAAIELLHDLVSIPSLSGQEAEAASFFVHWMSDHGFEARVDASGSAVGVRGHGDVDLMLLGHIDTFPGRLPVRREASTLHGRGSVDAKGSLAAFASAAAGIDPPPGVRLVVFGATEEESPSSRGAHHAMERFQPHACLIGEPSGWDRITLGYRGQMSLHWSWRGPLAHSAAPISSPAELAVGFWQAICQEVEAVNRGYSKEFSRLGANLTSINSGVNGSHGWAEMDVSLRLPPRLRVKEVQRRLQSLNGPGELEVIGCAQPFVAEKTNPLVAALLSAVRAEGGEPRFVHKTGTSDMNVVGPAWNCPIAAYGPGDSRLDHTPEEHLDLDEYLKSIEVLRHAIRLVIDRMATQH